MYELVIGPAKPGSTPRAPDGPSRLAGSGSARGEPVAIFLRAEPSRAVRRISRAEPSRAVAFCHEPSRAEPRVESREPSRAEPLQNHTSRAEPSRARIANREYGTLHRPNIGLNMHWHVANILNCFCDRFVTVNDFKILRRACAARAPRAEPSRAAPKLREPSRAEPWHFATSRAGPSRAQNRASRAEPSRSKIARAEPSRAAPPQLAEPARLGPSGALQLIQQQQLRAPAESAAS